MKHIQKIIDEELEAILDILRNRLGQEGQEPDFVLIRELGEYFKK